MGEVWLAETRSERGLIFRSAVCLGWLWKAALFLSAREDHRAPLYGTEWETGTERAMDRGLNNLVELLMNLSFWSLSVSWYSSHTGLPYTTSLWSWLVANRHGKYLTSFINRGVLFDELIQSLNHQKEEKDDVKLKPYSDYRSFKILNTFWNRVALHTWGETLEINFCWISNMLTPWDLNRMVHHIVQDIYKDYCSTGRDVPSHVISPGHLRGVNNKM